MRARVRMGLVDELAKPPPRDLLRVVELGLDLGQDFLLHPTDLADRERRLQETLAEQSDCLPDLLRGALDHPTAGTCRQNPADVLDRFRELDRGPLPGALVETRAHQVSEPVLVHGLVELPDRQPHADGHGRGARVLHGERGQAVCEPPLVDREGQRPHRASPPPSGDV